jgi:hypothetical protein
VHVVEVEEDLLGVDDHQIWCIRGLGSHMMPTAGAAAPWADTCLLDIPTVVGQAGASFVAGVREDAMPMQRVDADGLVDLVWWHVLVLVRDSRQPLGTL